MPVISLASKVFLQPKIHGYTRCEHMGFVKPDSVKLAMGHLLHGEAAPWNRALQTPVPPWIQGLVRNKPCTAWLLAFSLPLQSSFTWPSLHTLCSNCHNCLLARHMILHDFFMTCAMHGSWALGWFNPLFFEPVGTSPLPTIWLRKFGLLSRQSEPWVDAMCSLKIEHPGCAENQVLANHRCSAEHVLLHALVKYTIQLALQNTFSYTCYNHVFWAIWSSFINRGVGTGTIHLEISYCIPLGLVFKDFGSHDLEKHIWR